MKEKDIIYDTLEICLTNNDKEYIKRIRTQLGYGVIRLQLDSNTGVVIKVEDLEKIIGRKK